MKADTIEIAVAKYFGWRQNIIVPNVSWGMGLIYEADLWIVGPKSKCVREVEIKISAQDIKADLKKQKWKVPGAMRNVRQFYFAVPENLCTDKNIPEKAGILSIEKHNVVKEVRKAKINIKAVKLSDKEFEKLLHLGIMRIWKLKQQLINKGD